MTNENQNQTESVKMYRPWVGVILSFFMAGASQFLSGRKLIGIAWFGMILLLDVAAFWCLASPLVSGDLLAFALWIISIVLWIVMLVKSYRPVPSFRWFGWILFILLALLIEKMVFYSIRACFHPFKIPTASMSPTIQGNRKLPDGTRVGGDCIFIEGCAYWFAKPQRGDVVAYKVNGIVVDQRELYHLPPNECYIKRIVGIPGDVLSIQNGRLYNHGQALSEPVFFTKLEFPDFQFPSQVYLTSPTNDYAVPDGSYFVIGDNITNSLDSRFYGAISEKGIIGRASKIYWPLQRVGKIQ
jgi:signal peptidase I